MRLPLVRQRFAATAQPVALRCGGAAGVVAGARSVVGWFWFVLAAFLFAGVTNVHALPSEPELKAAFLLNLPKYITWPEERFAGPDAAFVIGVLGGSPIHEAVEPMAARRNVNGRGIEVRRVTPAEIEAGECHLVLVAPGEIRRMEELHAALAGAGVLLVGESEGFLESGGAIALVARERKISLEINLRAARSQGLNVSSKLLSIASVVEGREEQR